MCLTLESDYAIRIVGCLTSVNRRSDAKYISEQTGVSLRFSLKILRKLVAAGIVRSYKGIQGGYELAKSPADITLYDVITAIEGGYFLNKCHDSDFICTRNAKDNCSFRRVFTEISEIVSRELASHSFETLINGNKK